MPLNQFLSLFKRNQTAFHNLCQHSKPPAGIERLLWLGLKFCIQKPVPKPDITKSFERFRRSVRIIDAFKDEFDTGDYNPKIYIPNDDFEPDDCKTPLIEEAMQRFHNGLLNLVNNHSPKRAHNLSRQTRFLLEKLSTNREFIIVPTDKNLGPAIMERSVYKARCLQDHLLKAHTYRQLSKTEANAILAAALETFKSLFEEYKESLPKDEATYLYRAIQLNHRVAQFYILPKVHKNPWKTRPVVSDIGSSMSYLSKFIDVYLQRLIKLVQGYLKDSQSLIKSLKALGKLPPSAVIIIADAVAMPPT